MILSAGLGTRLRPLTLSTPKALLLVAQRPMIVYMLLLLKKYGIEEAVINLHHLGEHLEKELGTGKKFGVKIRYSWEREILGTGGGILKAAGKLTESLLVLNSDILIDLNLHNFIRFHKNKGGIASMVVRERDPDSNFSVIRTNRTQRVLSIEESPTTSKESAFMYTGVQILEPKLLDYLPKAGPSCIIRQGYLPALQHREKIYAFPYRGYWNDMGTLDRYRQADQDLTSGKIK